MDDALRRRERERIGEAPGGELEVARLRAGRAPPALEAVLLLEGLLPYGGAGARTEAWDRVELGWALASWGLSELAAQRAREAVAARGLLDGTAGGAFLARAGAALVRAGVEAEGRQLLADGGRRFRDARGRLLEDLRRRRSTPLPGLLHALADAGGLPLSELPELDWLLDPALLREAACAAGRARGGDFRGALDPEELRSALQRAALGQAACQALRGAPPGGPELLALAGLGAADAADADRFLGALEDQLADWPRGSWPDPEHMEAVVLAVELGSLPGRVRALVATPGPAAGRAPWLRPLVLSGLACRRPPSDSGLRPARDALGEGLQTLLGAGANRPQRQRSGPGEELLALLGSGETSGRVSREQGAEALEHLLRGLAAATWIDPAQRVELAEPCLERAAALEVPGWRPALLGLLALAGATGELGGRLLDRLVSALAACPPGRPQHLSLEALARCARTASLLGAGGLPAARRLADLAGGLAQAAAVPLLLRCARAAAAADERPLSQAWEEEALARRLPALPPREQAEAVTLAAEGACEDPPDERGRLALAFAQHLARGPELPGAAAAIAHLAAREA